jgi:hypothetical protein
MDQMRTEHENSIAELRAQIEDLEEENGKILEKIIKQSKEKADKLSPPKEQVQFTEENQESIFATNNSL